MPSELEKALKQQSANEAFHVQSETEISFETIPPEKLLEGIDQSDLIPPTEKRVVIPEKPVEKPQETPAPEKINADNYARDENGNIKYKKDGVTPQLKRGRQAGKAASAAPATENNYEESLKGFMHATLACGYILGGDDFMPDKDDLKMLETSMTPLAQKYPDFKLPPELTAVIGAGTYIYNQREKKKTFKEKMDENIKRWVEKFKKMIGKGET